MSSFTSFTYAGEFHRGKGQRKIRSGPRIRLGERYADDKKDRKAKAPDAIALRKLEKLLLGAPGFSKRLTDNTIAKVARADQLRFMNMQVLAEVLQYLNQYKMHEVEGYNIDPLTFYDSITPYLNRLVPEKDYNSEIEYEIVRLRMAATMLRYIRFVEFYQQLSSQKFEEKLAATDISEISDIRE